MHGSPNASWPERHDVSVVLDKEAWRYSERAWQALQAQPFIAAPPAQLPSALVESFDWPETRDRRIVFVNGNADFSDDLRLRDGERLHLVFANVAGAQPRRWQREFAIRLEHGSAEVIEQHIGTAGTDVLGELRSRVHVDAGAQLRMTTLCDLPDSVSLYRQEQVEVGAGAQYQSAHILFGGRLQRFDLGVEMAGAGGDYSARGVFAPRARAHIDVHLDARHGARDTHSDVLWRGVADQRGRGILHGAITVAAGADGADAQLQTKNLLLSPHAEIDAQPVLEIYADEVKASHGATVGQLDERALFYLRSRGVPLATARNLLISGFCREAFDGIADTELRARLEALLAARLPQAGEAA
jgi:Fe-S cluster assembly protein SufD